ncbi:hypothetical protein CUJ84_pRLN3000296 (plasmid) [Rhizobium leguminosarum]|uniref:Uncharacterized protein n=1 Tax=Rhizobium leguminosarum TaxID=384 RepID=A0A2K9ZH98_RHILE|nr:hypothetical protein CUJ84_pRLN3000296 [Rhizobium leguminosarum]
MRKFFRSSVCQPSSATLQLPSITSIEFGICRSGGSETDGPDVKGHSRGANSVTPDSGLNKKMRFPLFIEVSERTELVMA